MSNQKLAIGANEIHCPCLGRQFPPVMHCPAQQPISVVIANELLAFRIPFELLFQPPGDLRQQAQVGSFEKSSNYNIDSHCPFRQTLSVAMPALLTNGQKKTPLEQAKEIAAKSTAKTALKDIKTTRTMKETI